MNNRSIGRLMSIVLVSLLLIGSAGPQARAQDVTVSYQSFYDNLAPYGQWVTDPQYGNVWVPNEAGDFRPYGSRGHWVMTEYGNTWVSDDPWGWACYHYGRWTYDPYYGWVWIPGYEWAPAWVSWRFGGGYSGWAPLGPGGDLSYNCPQSWWIFIGPQYMYEPNCMHYWRGPSYNGTYMQQTTLVNNYYVDNRTHVRYNYGPRAEAIQQVTHQPVQTYHVSQSNRPGAPGISGNNVSLYRPTVNRATVSSARPANAVTAPRAIGTPHENNTLTASKQPAFRQQIQNRPANTTNNAGPHNAPAQTNNNRPAMNNAQPANRPQQNTQQQPAHNNQFNNNNRPQQAAPQQRPTPQQQQRPQQPAPQQRPQQAPQQRPQQPMPQQRPQQAPQQRPQQPMPQQRPMEQPHNEAPHEAPHEGGRR